MSLTVIFMGSSPFSVSILRALHQVYPVNGVVTQPARQAGRGKQVTQPPVKEAADELQINIIQPERLKAPEVFEQLTSWKPDLIVVAAYGQILRQNVLDLPKYGCINVHASHLPRWRGASPIQAAILNGDQETGVTIIKMDAGIDTGPEIAKRRLPIDANEDFISLSDKLAAAGAELLVQSLPGYLAGDLPPTAQPDSGATYAPMIKKEDGLLDFTQPAITLERKVRAYLDWPGASFMHDGLSIKVRKAQAIPGQFGPPGTRLILNEKPVVSTSEGALVLLKIQPAGKKAMSGDNFLNGCRNW